MSSTPYSPMANEQAGPVHSRNGSIGPVIGVLAVIAVLGAVAVIIGRLFSGKKIMGKGQYDVESWMEIKCGSCIGGNVSNPPPVAEEVVVVQPMMMVADGGATSGVAVVEPSLEGTNQAPQNQQQFHETLAIGH